MTTTPASGGARRANRRRLFIVLTLLIATFFGLTLLELTLRVYVWSRGWTSNCYLR